jgi:hypothetical protein
MAGERHGNGVVCVNSAYELRAVVLQCAVGRDVKLDSVAAQKLLVLIGGNSKRISE